MAPLLLTSFSIPICFPKFYQHFWLDSAWYTEFLTEQLKDINVSVGKWNVDNSDEKKTRCITSMHPSKIQFPGLASHAESMKVQSMQIFDGRDNEKKMIVKETNTFNGIPYADYFEVNIEWTITSAQMSPDEDHDQDYTQNHKQSCFVYIYLDFTFHKYTWLQGTIESNTKAELLEIYELWLNCAQRYILHSIDSATIATGTKENSLSGDTLPLDSSITTSRRRLREKNGDMAPDDEDNQIEEEIELKLGTQALTHIQSEAHIHGVSSVSSDLQLMLSSNTPYMPSPSPMGTSVGSLRKNHTTEQAGGLARTSNSRDSRHNLPLQSWHLSLDPLDTEQGMEYASSYYGTDDEEKLLFYDCEDGRGERSSRGSDYDSPDTGFYFGSRFFGKSESNLNMLQDAGPSDSDSTSSGSRTVDSCNTADDSNSNSGSKACKAAMDAGVAGDRRVRPGVSRNTYPGVGDDGQRHIQDRPRGRGQKKIRQNARVKERPAHSPRDVAVNIVETAFVLAQSVFWQMHRWYMYDLKEVFNVEPMMVLVRIKNSFLPGCHQNILLHPDLYGPLFAVFCLPQSLLISMEIAKNGCNPTSQLGNAVIVSLCIWTGLSVLYRIMSYVIAPTITLKHCLSMTGYSFFSWTIALLAMFPLEKAKEHNVHGFSYIPVTLPLMVLGIPSSVALGYMFWDQTPSSSMTLKPDVLPTSMQHFATVNSRWLQRMLWALPKIIAFLIVAGTHYQFLWYVARVFLPGRKNICRLNAMLQPSQYRDILTQKEFRTFALSVLKKGNGKG